MRDELAAKRAAFRALHRAGCFVLPNPWDAGSAATLQRLGFAALASTSAGAAWTLGKQDGEITRDEALAHLRALCAATELPVNADFENGFADDPAAVAANVTLALATGIAGISIEDRRRPGGALYGAEAAAERIAAARRALDADGTGAVLVGRCEAFLAGGSDLGEVIARLQRYAEAGADCVYAPGVIALDQVTRLVAAVAPVPVNVLLNEAGTTVADLAAAGVRRVSVGGALARIARRAFERAATSLAERGTFPDRR